MFVTFEGGEGGGKSTALRTVAARLREDGITVVETREPGNGPFGAQVRKLLLEDEGMSAKAELFLFLADRAEHMATLVEPALARGEWVLSDRHADSTYVYQAAVRGLDPEFVNAANRFAAGGRTPDLTLLFDLDPRVGLDRLLVKDRLDRQPIEFHEAVRAGFLALAHADPHRFVILDASNAPEAVASRAFTALAERSGRKKRLD